MPKELNNYQHRGGRALVLLHEKHLRKCLATWKEASNTKITLPETEDENYTSMETLLCHILGAPRGYMTWICKSLDLPDPVIEPAPEPESVEASADAYVEHLLARWRLPLADVEPDRYYNPEYPSNGGTHHHCIDIMLQHAVMHPIRHDFQLQELIEKQKG